MNIPKVDLPRIVIVGGGFAGITLAKKLGNKNVQVVVLDRHNYHTFQPLLYQVSSSGLEPDSIAYPIRKIIKNHKHSYFRLANVSEINAEVNAIETDIGTLTYDFLVLATGTRTNFFGNEEVKNNSMPMKTVPQALNIRSLILQNFEAAAITKSEEERKALLNFVIVGGGPTGVELAGAIAELRKNIIPKDYHDLDKSDMKIHLLEGLERLLNAFDPELSQKAEKYLKELNVDIHCNTLVENYDGTDIKTNSDLELQSKTLIWAAGVTGNPVNGLKAESFFEKANRYKVDVFNKVEGYNNIFAIGDIALMESDEYPKGHPQVAQPAIQQGKHLGDNLLRKIDGGEMKPFQYNDKGSMATIGRNRAVVEIGKYRSAGFFAWFIWMFVHLFSLVGFRNRIIVFFNWSYNYINFDKAARLIIRPYKKK